MLMNARYPSIVIFYTFGDNHRGLFVQLNSTPLANAFGRVNYPYFWSM